MVEASDGDGNWICRRSVLALLDAHTAAQPAPDAVAEAARSVMAAWRKSAPMMTADYHGDDCDCLRCAMGDLEHALAKGSRP